MDQGKIKWYRCIGGALSQSIKRVEKKVMVQFPALFSKLLKECDAGIPLQTDFHYFDVSHKCLMPQSVGGFLGVEDSEYNILEIYNSPPEFFPDGLVAFAETGGGDLICFDYREGKDNPDPAIVYWNHEADIGKDVSFIAENFEAFLGMLKKPED